MGVAHDGKVEDDFFFIEILGEGGCTQQEQGDKARR
jgi:hypothetical protein